MVSGSIETLLISFFFFFFASEKHTMMMARRILGMKKANWFRENLLSRWVEGLELTGKSIREDFEMS